MTRIALAQVDVTVGDFQGNLANMRAFYERAKEAGAHLVVFPELAIPGYHARDLFNREGFLRANTAALQEAAAWTAAGPALLMGYCDWDEGEHSPSGRPVRRNAAAFCQDGKVEEVVHKTLLPTYDVFDESRYFRPAGRHMVIPFRGHLLGVTICEDLWDERYKTKPSDLLGAMGATVLINLSASPFHERKHALRLEVFREQATRHRVPVLVCNLVGGQDELIFDGGSLALDREGETVAQGALFTEDLVVVDLRDDGLALVVGRREAPEVGREETLFSACVLGVKDYFAKTGFSRALLGLSGGVDSALVAAVAAAAVGPENTLAFYLPYKHNSEQSARLAAEVAQGLGVRLRTLPIGPAVDLVREMFESEMGKTRRPVTDENLQARLRGLFLMQVANDREALLLAPGNKTELALGYATLYGDMCGAIAPISDLTKLDVLAISGWLADQGRLPREVVERRPTAELAPGQFDPFDYAVVSPLADEMVGDEATLADLETRYPPQLVKEVARRVRLAEFKRRQMPMGLKLTPKAYGVGRRYPIAQKFIPEE
ncbi:NAD+ synthase [bacterium]|nr:NAD+ synthase [bacterium]